MRLSRVRFTIGRLMIVVAVAGALSTWLRVPNAGILSAAVVLIFTPPLIALMSPFLFSRPGRRLLAMTWIASLWPLSIPWSIHAAWLVAYGFLGHALGPADDGPVIEFLAGSILLFLGLSLLSTILCLFLLLYAVGKLTEGEDPWADGTIPVLVTPLAWFSVIVVGQWDPLRAVWWFMD
jgi:hypothetical protein